ncbi:OLC1v1006292C1 [Oldenlandia corymbosa var. corymbosa]|uniref:OLC1v1006292C1 n=1 Tax=Oldenlandia corymbosa var. corymbosa TaxID=529605 RepID=A0AAV1DJ09_OLDCO|nr:OLC1v1006292C1 [Oldenlandia corymbosa var. corymbosa]
MENMDEMMNGRFLSKPPRRPLTMSSPPSTLPAETTIEHAPVVAPADGSMNLVAAGESISVAPPPHGQELTALNLDVLPRVNLEELADGINGMLMQNHANPPPPENNGSLMKMEFVGPSIPTLEEALKIEKSGREPDEEKKLRRTISNRLSAQRSRVKKLNYIAGMKKRIKALEDHMAFLNPTLEMLKLKQAELKNERTVLEQKLNRCMDQSIICNRQIDGNRAEITRLKELLVLKKEHKKMMTSNEIGIPDSTSAIFGVSPPESFTFRTESCTGFNSKQNGALSDALNNNVDHEVGIEQYLNLDALGLSPSTQPTNDTS